MIKAIIAFIVGFVACMAIVYTINTVQRRRTRKKRKPRKDGEKVTTTKIVLFSILFTYFAAFALAMYIVCRWRDSICSCVLLLEGKSGKFRENQKKCWT